MIIIGFSVTSSDKVANMFCRKFKHCVVIFKTSTTMDLIQIAKDGVRILKINETDLLRLKNKGWVFIPAEQSFNKLRFPIFLSCTGFAKKTLGIKNPFIWFPDGLHKYLIKKYR